MAMGVVMLSLESQQAGLTISKLSGRSKEWALMFNASVDAAFPTVMGFTQKIDVSCVRTA